MRHFLLFCLTLTLHAQIPQLRQQFNFTTVTVEKRSAAVVKKYYGKTVPDERRIHDVTLRFDAFVTELFADTRYRQVKKGEPLLRLYSKEVLALAEELVLSRRLSASAARNAARKLRLLGLEHLTKIKKVPETFSYFSPAEGYIVSKEVNRGSFAPKGKVLFQIADFSTIWVIADIYQRDIAQIHEGMRAKVSIEGYPDAVGKISYIYPRVDPKSRTIPVCIELKNESNLFPGLFATVRIESTPGERLLLPKTAIVRKGEKYYVFIPEGEGEFTPREVKAYRFDSIYYAVTEGVEVGEKVADKALFLLDSDALTNGLYESDAEDEEW